MRPVHLNQARKRGEEEEGNFKELLQKWNEELLEGGGLSKECISHVRWNIWSGLIGMRSCLMRGFLGEQ